VSAVNVALVLKYVEVELIDRQGKEAHGYHSSLDIYILSHLVNTIDKHCSSLS
jgi:hypothetical protein